MPSSPPTKEDIKAKIKELEQRYEALEHRDQYLVELQAWMTKRKLVHMDLLWMYRQMAPKRAQRAVKSKKPLHPEVRAARIGYEIKGDPDFMQAIRRTRLKLKMTTLQVAEKVGVSDATISNWEGGRNTPVEEKRQKILEVLKLTPDLGAEATARQQAFRGTSFNSGAPPGE
jgi:DNA-binding transcriptional regulator YiaG